MSDRKVLLARWGQVHHDNGFGRTQCGIMIPQAATEVSDGQLLVHGLMMCRECSRIVQDRRPR